MRLARHAALIVLVLVLLHGGVWLVVSGLVQGQLAQARSEATADWIDIRVGSVERAGYPLAAGVLWRDVEFGPRGLPFGTRVSTARIALTLVPSLRHAPAYRADLPDPVRIVLTNGATIVLAAPDARVEAAWGDPGVPTLTATAVTVANPVEIADIARLRITLRSAARTLDVRADGVEWRGGPTTLPPIATLAADLALDGPSAPALAEGGPAMRGALARWRDGGGALRMVRAALGWGPADVEAQGRLSLDAQLRPAATGELRVAGGDAGLRVLAASGVLASHAAQAARALLALLPATVKVAGRDAVRLPVAIASGRLDVAGYPLLKLAPLSPP